VNLALPLLYLWAFPGTLIGLLLGATTGTRPTRRGRAGDRLTFERRILVFESTSGFASLHRRMGFSAIALGHVVIANRELSPQEWLHEQVHVVQWEAFGPLMLILYPLMSIAGYRRNPFERDARRRTGT
jgi:hypothetical protein